MRKEQEGYEACKEYWSLAESVEFTFVTLLLVIWILKIHYAYWVLCCHTDYHLLSIKTFSTQILQTCHIS